MFIGLFHTTECECADKNYRRQPYTGGVTIFPELKQELQKIVFCGISETEDGPVTRWIGLAIPIALPAGSIPKLELETLN